MDDKMNEEEARKLCCLIKEKQNIIPPVWLLMKAFPNNNVDEWLEEDKL